MTGIAAGASGAESGTESGADSEVLELRRELDHSNQGLIALHAELSDRQEELECARAAAEQASKDKADFLANMSHEIRSPMSAVVGFTGLLRCTELTSEQAEYIAAVEAAAAHLLGVINGILDLSKIESGSLELEEIPFDLFACVEDAVDMLAVEAEAKNLTLTALFAPALPATIVGDPLRLRQVLVNLLANAVKFTTHGNVTVEVTQLAGAARPAGIARTGGIARLAGVPEQATGPPDPAAARSCQLVFGVRDTGIGIPADRVGLLFAPYAQADASTARIHGGTGLGLTISRQLTERMGGTIAVASAVGEGTTITAMIPARLAGPSPASGDNDLFLSGSQVLLVSEQALHAEAIGRHLTGWGADVVTAPSAGAALSRSGDWRRAALAIIDASRPATLAGDIARLTAASANRSLPIVCVAPTASRAALASAGEPRPSVRTPIRRYQLRQAVLAALGQAGQPLQAA
jgi:signal transduction histidine kinase